MSAIFTTQHIESLRNGSLITTAPTPRPTTNCAEARARQCNPQNVNVNSAKIGNRSREPKKLWTCAWIRQLFVCCLNRSRRAHRMQSSHCTARLYPSEAIAECQQANHHRGMTKKTHRKTTKHSRIHKTHTQPCTGAAHKEPCVRSGPISAAATAAAAAGGREPPSALCISILLLFIVCMLCEHRCSQWCTSRAQCCSLLAQQPGYPG